MASNTTFVSGAIYTAQMANNFPFGVQIYGQNITTATGMTTDTTVVTGTMTAIANRLYRMTYFEPQMTGSAAGAAQLKIKDTATQLQMTYTVIPAASQENNGIISVVTTLSAGAHTILATINRASAITLTATRSATQPAVFTVEDIGPA